MSIRKIVLIPSLLLLASVAWLAFRPHTPSTSPALPAAPKAVARAAPAGHAVDRDITPPTAAVPAHAAVPAAATRAVNSTVPASPYPAVPTAPAPVDAQRVLADAGPMPAFTSMGPVPAEGSGLYGAPDRLSARLISANRAEGREHDVKSGDAVRIRYRMYELMSGREVESSPPEGILVRVGVAEDAAATAVNRVPRSVAESLSHARLGDVLEIVLPKETRDLPPDLDSTAAHKIHITVVGRY